MHGGNHLFVTVYNYLHPPQSPLTIPEDIGGGTGEESKNRSLWIVGGQFQELKVRADIRDEQR